ncbi:hypothetical protein QM716_25250 [Rhodococcus sp. IEGM 1409]|uniref:hypothetical protein n=1 Tax=Rhodococcus sp. IEGM 1409 TaxID=3047082 RepID=UPI0024B8592E|nr:hypothetical protein [Rhodococcus sp. IEGM 1409]MDI9903167.1 hypothetical protein [Rhodococcus sp. IEGM 1409]
MFKYAKPAIVGLTSVLLYGSAHSLPADWGSLGGEAANQKSGWQLVSQESFNTPLKVDSAPWQLDPQGEQSPWHIDDFDDDSPVWSQISGPAATTNMDSLNVFRKRVAFGKNDWLTAEIAAVDKDKDGTPDSQPGLSTVKLPGGEKAAKINEPSWDGGVIIRPTTALPEEYRVEMTLRGIDFGGKRNGTFDYDGKTNGYAAGDCKTGFPWTFKGAAPDKSRCQYGDVKPDNGFYYMTILDHDNPAPHGNPGIHYRRKVIMDGYYATSPWTTKYGTCNPATGEIYSSTEGNYNGVNAIFPRGDKFRPQNNNISTEYYYKTSCGDYDGAGTFGDKGQYKDILTTAEIQPELMPDASYTFAVERDKTGYTIEMSGPFSHIGQTTLRYHSDFVENGRPIWHYNQKPEEYNGEFDQQLNHTGPAGTNTTEHTWPAGSAYPDSFVIGDPHLNYYEGSAVVDDIKLFVPSTKTGS